MEKQVDVVVIGAGPAGSVAASRLIQEDYSVLVLEKAVFPRFVIGESLLPQAMNYLDKVDLLRCVEDQNFQVKTGVVFYHNEEVCTFYFNDRFTDGWDYTYQVKRAQFDHALIRETEAKGVEVVFNAEVVDVETSANEQRVEYVNEKGERVLVKTKFVIDASGYGRVLPRMFNIEKAPVSVPRGAVFAHINDAHRTQEEGTNIFVHAFRDNSAWIWSIPFSDGTASVGVVGNSDFVVDCAENQGTEFRRLVSEFPGMSHRFSDQDFLFEPRKLLNYSISVEQMYGEGYVLCGNSTEFLDPIFSSGVTLAVASGYEAAELVSRKLKGENPDWEGYERFLRQGIEVFRSYVEAWYKGELHTIFFTKDGNPEFKRQICSVLAGYVWDKTNPFVKKHATVLSTLSKVIKLNSIK